MNEHLAHTQEERLLQRAHQVGARQATTPMHVAEAKRADCGLPCYPLESPARSAQLARSWSWHSQRSQPPSPEVNATPHHAAVQVEQLPLPVLLPHKLDWIQVAYMRSPMGRAQHEDAARQRRGQWQQRKPQQSTPQPRHSQQRSHSHASLGKVRAQSLSALTSPSQMKAAVPSPSADIFGSTAFGLSPPQSPAQSPACHRPVGVAMSRPPSAPVTALGHSRSASALNVGAKPTTRPGTSVPTQRRTQTGTEGVLRAPSVPLTALPS